MLFLTCWACNAPHVLYENYHTLPCETWNRDSIVHFRVELPEAGLYTLSIGIRHSTDYKYGDIVCYLLTSFNGQVSERDTIHVPFIDKDGAWLGVGVNGLKTLTRPLEGLHRFDSAGTYIFRIGHQMKEKELKGIKNIGIQITRNQSWEKTN